MDVQFGKYWIYEINDDIREILIGIHFSVWDLYEEDMQEYQAKKQEIRAMFEKAGEPLPASLERSNKSVVEEMEDEMDPTMKAFRAMERKLKG